jgi:predicted PurR-regulated permease PerM
LFRRREKRRAERSVSTGVFFPFVAIGDIAFMTMLTASVRHLAAALVVGALAVAALVLGQAILIPLAGATIVSFMLAPIVRWLSARGLPHGLSVAGVLVIVLSMLVGATMMLSIELLSITARISDYRENLTAKVRTVLVLGRDDGVFKRAADSIDQLTEALGHELARPTGRDAQTTDPSGAPIAVTTVDNSPSAAIARFTAWAEPGAKFALLLLFTLFLLLQHQDMRDRIVRVFGTDHLTETTSAMSDAGKRLSRLFLAQALMSAAYGVVIGLVLWTAGVPGALLWAVVSALMRFVPFIGSYIAAVPPILLAASVDPGWGLAIFTAIFFVVSELVMGNLVEPLVLGRRVGLSPFAMIAAASFWTLVWGTVGLLLAAPLTMTLVVLGRYVPGLAFVSILLGDEPALEPHQELYHRLLSGDALAAAEHIETASEASNLVQTTDGLLLPALMLAANDARNGRLSQAQATAIHEAVEEAIELVPGLGTPQQNEDTDVEALVVPVRGEIDITAAIFLARLISARSCQAASSHATGLTALASIARRDGEAPLSAIVIANVGGIPRRQLQFIAARAARDHPGARILVLAPTTSRDATSQTHPEAQAVAQEMSTVAELLANLEIEKNNPTADPTQCDDHPVSPTAPSAVNSTADRGTVIV